jgi:ketosteroid isomerase-like protein
MGEDDDRARVVRRLHQAFNERERAAMLECLAEGVVWQVAGDHPLAGTYEGRDRLWEDYLEPMWASPARIEDVAVRGHGEYVIAAGYAVHDFGEGEQRFETVEVLRLEDGRVIERSEFTSGQAEVDRLITRGCAAALEHAPD